MKIIGPSVEIIEKTTGKEQLELIERCGRVCYKSESAICDGSAEKLIKNLIKSGHESVIEHGKITVLITCDRGVTHEFVRHRIASYSQESTRYCNYSKDKFDNELTFIKPSFWEDNDLNYKIWYREMERIEDSYMAMIENGATPQEARSILPNSLKTEIAVSMDMRAWRNFFHLRCDKAAHPDMRKIADLLLKEFKNYIPVVFDDISNEIESEG